MRGKKKVTVVSAQSLAAKKRWARTRREQKAKAKAKPRPKSGGRGKRTNKDFLKAFLESPPVTADDLVVVNDIPEFLPTENDPVNHPRHYTEHKSGVECIQITEFFDFCLGNAIKYIWRSGETGNQIRDLEKARWYLDREITRLKGTAG